MSRGDGRIEVAVWKSLKQDREVLSVKFLAKIVFFGELRSEKATPAMRASVNRAIHSLQRKGYKIEARALRGGGDTGLYYATPAGWRQFERRRKREREGLEKELEKDRARIFGNMYGSRRERPPKRVSSASRISPSDRRKLVKILGMLGSDHEGERAAAGLMAEELRKRLGLDWAGLLKA